MSDVSARRAALTAVLVLALVAGLAGVAGVGSSGADPGPRAAVGGIEDLVAYEPQTRCDPTEQPGVVAFRDLVLEHYPSTRGGGITRPCHVGGRSEHKEGRAWDWMVDASDPVEAAMAEGLIDWLLAGDGSGNAHAMARRLGVMYVIWDGRIWSAGRSAQGWRPYRGANPHVDHVHVSFGREGAAKATSYWDAEVEVPAPPGE